MLVFLLSQSKLWTVFARRQGHGVALVVCLQLNNLSQKASLMLTLLHPHTLIHYSNHRDLFLQICCIVLPYWRYFCPKIFHVLSWFYPYFHHLPYLASVQTMALRTPPQVLLGHAMALC